MKIRTQFVQGLVLVAATLSSAVSFAQNATGAATIRPAGYKPKTGDAAAGEMLFVNDKLSTNGMSCATCHANNASFTESFAKPYPHKVTMANDVLNIKSIQLDEMIQACMVMPMEAKPLSWNSKELADLTAYVVKIQKSFKLTN